MKNYYYVENLVAVEYLIPLLQKSHNTAFSSLNRNEHWMLFCFPQVGIQVVTVIRSTSMMTTMVGFLSAVFVH